MKPLQTHPSLQNINKLFKTYPRKGNKTLQSFPSIPSKNHTGYSPLLPNLLRRHTTNANNKRSQQVPSKSLTLSKHQALTKTNNRYSSGSITKIHFLQKLSFLKQKTNFSKPIPPQNNKSDSQSSSQLQEQPVVIHRGKAGGERPFRIRNNSCFTGSFVHSQQQDLGTLCILQQQDKKSFSCIKNYHGTKFLKQSRFRYKRSKSIVPGPGSYFKEDRPIKIQKSAYFAVQKRFKTVQRQVPSPGSYLYEKYKLKNNQSPCFASQVSRLQETKRQATPVVASNGRPVRAIHQVQPMQKVQAKSIAFGSQSKRFKKEVRQKNQQSLFQFLSKLFFKEKLKKKTQKSTAKPQKKLGPFLDIWLNS